MGPINLALFQAAGAQRFSFGKPSAKLALCGGLPASPACQGPDAEERGTVTESPESPATTCGQQAELDATEVAARSLSGRGRAAGLRPLPSSAPLWES